MPTTEQIIDTRARVWQAMQAIVDTCRKAGRNLTGDELREYDRRDAELDQLTEQITSERVQRHDERARLYNAPATGEVPMSGTTTSTRTAEDERWTEYLRTGHDAELRAAGVATGAATPATARCRRGSAAGTALEGAATCSSRLRPAIAPGHL